MHVPLERTSVSDFEALEAFVTEEARRPFDLTKGPLVRTHLLRLGDQDHVLLVCAHHVISDGWSIELLSNELTALYQAFHHH